MGVVPLDVLGVTVQVVNDALPQLGMVVRGVEERVPWVAGIVTEHPRIEGGQFEARAISADSESDLLVR